MLTRVRITSLPP